MMNPTYEFDRRPPKAAPGESVALSPRVRRVIADNPSPMTFSGTASYLVGHGQVALIDPGPDDPNHIDAIFAALAPGEQIEAIFVTHRHFDHSRGVPLVQERTGIPCYAAAAQPTAIHDHSHALEILGTELGGGEGIDPDFEPDIALTDGDVVTSATMDATGEPAWRMQAIHTPGHLDDHLCFVIESESALFTGDHVMGWSSSVLSPPEGDHGTFMRSLARLVDRSTRQIDKVYYPGHGNPVRAPTALVEHLIGRRERREQTILEMLDGQTRSFDDLVLRLYPIVVPSLLLAARRTLLAHLIDLRMRGLVTHSIDSPLGLNFTADIGGVVPTT